jgi:hypothetical protein
MAPTKLRMAPTGEAILRPKAAFGGGAVMWEGRAWRSKVNGRCPRLNSSEQKVSSPTIG